MSETTKMTVKEFVDKYNATTIDNVKIAMVRKLITRTYAPALEKRVLLQMNFDKSLMEENGIQYIDRFLGQVNLMFCILALYTNLNIVHKKDENGESESSMFDDYDLLIQYDIYPLILREIGERELKEVMNIYSAIEETFMNKQNTEAYIAKQITRFGTILGAAGDSGLKQLASVLENEENMDTFVNKLKGITSKIKIVK